MLYKDRDTGAIDIVFDPHNSNVLYATLWQMRRQPWNFSSGGPGSGLYKSTDGGLTSAHLEGHGLPDGILGRMACRSRARTRSASTHSSRRRKAACSAPTMPDGSWSRINESSPLPSARLVLLARVRRPTVADVLYIMNTGAFRSSDGGKTICSSVLWLEL